MDDDTQTPSDIRPPSKLRPPTSTYRSSKLKPSSGGQSEPETEPEPGSEPEVEPEIEPERQSETEPEVDVESERDAEADAEEEPEPEAEPEPDFRLESDIQPEPNVLPEPPSRATPEPPIRSYKGPAVELRAVARRYGATQALHDLSLTVPQGKVYALLGPIGAGKTTAILIMMGFLFPDRGEARTFGHDPHPARLPLDMRRLVGFMPQESVLPAHLKVGQVIGITRGFYPTWDRTFEAHLVTQLDLSVKLNWKVRQLSLVEVKRLSLLLAMAHKPELLILDEPADGLDPATRRTFLGQVTTLIADEGKTVVFSSHLMSDVERIADRIGIVQEGSITLERNLEEIKTASRLVSVEDVLVNPKVLSDIPGLLAHRASAGKVYLLVERFNDRTKEILDRKFGTGAGIVTPKLEDFYIELTR